MTELPEDLLREARAWRERYANGEFRDIVEAMAAFGMAVRKDERERAARIARRKIVGGYMHGAPSGRTAKKSPPPSSPTRSRAMLTLEGGKKYQPKDDDPVCCEEHGVTVRWGELDAIQQLAVVEGIDVDGRCILLPKEQSHAE